MSTHRDSVSNRWQFIRKSEVVRVEYTAFEILSFYISVYYVHVFEF